MGFDNIAAGVSEAFIQGGSDLIAIMKHLSTTDLEEQKLQQQKELETKKLDIEKAKVEAINSMRDEQNWLLAKFRQQNADNYAKKVEGDLAIKRDNAENYRKKVEGELAIKRDKAKNAENYREKAERDLADNYEKKVKWETEKQNKYNFDLLKLQISGFVERQKQLYKILGDKYALSSERDKAKEEIADIDAQIKELYAQMSAPSSASTAAPSRGRNPYLDLLDR